jgi:type 1 glutamine amidotransferase
MKIFFKLILVFAVISCALEPAQAADKRIVLVAGTPSHGPGEHEFNADCLLLKRCLDQVPGVTAVVYRNGWPKEKDAFAGADAIVLYMDGGDGHPAIQEDHPTQLAVALKHGAGLACLHYAVEVPADKGGKEFLNWIGGYFETFWSVNPTWTADFKELPKHPITRGVKPFEIYDEWYYHMRFTDDRARLTPILSAIPPESTRNRPDDAHGGNQFVRARTGLPEEVAWVYERPDGGRGFGFTGAHYHKNWGDDNFRKLVLNAILWIAKAEVPAGGVGSSLTPPDLKLNLDPKDARK